MPTDSVSNENPRLSRIYVGGLVVHADSALQDRAGIVVAFSERQGGMSAPPYASLNLAAHVGDEPENVDENRLRFLSVCGLGQLADRLVTAEQVHGTEVAEVGAAGAGDGAHAARGASPVAGTDALVTTEPGVPLMMFFADCVPIVLVAEGPTPAVAVVHAGWRGALAGIAQKTARVVAARSGADAESILAYIGPHIGRCCYEVDESMISQFRSRFGTICAVDGRLDLGAVVAEDLLRAGLRARCVATIDTCTRDHSDRFFSYRACQVTGRHGALAAIAKGE